MTLLLFLKTLVKERVGEGCFSFLTVVDEEDFPNSFLGRPCILQKNTDSFCGEPGIRLIVVGGPNKEVLRDGGEPNKDFLNGAVEEDLLWKVCEVDACRGAACS